MRGMGRGSPVFWSQHLGATLMEVIIQQPTSFVSWLYLLGHPSRQCEILSPSLIGYLSTYLSICLSQMSLDI